VFKQEHLSEDFRHDEKPKIKKAIRKKAGIKS